MAKLRREERSTRTEAEAGDSRRDLSPGEWQRVREATEHVIERRRKVLEELAKH